MEIPIHCASLFGTQVRRKVHYISGNSKKKTVENEELAFTSYFLTRKNVFKGFYGNTPVPSVY